VPRGFGDASGLTSRADVPRTGDASALTERNAPRALRCACGGAVN